MDKGFWHDSAPSGTNWQNGEMVRAAGFEPDEPPLEIKGLRGCAHASAHTFAQLAEVVAEWPRLSEPLRAGILAIVRSANMEKGVMK